MAFLSSSSSSSSSSSEKIACFIRFGCSRPCRANSWERVRAPFSSSRNWSGDYAHAHAPLHCRAAASSSPISSFYAAMLIIESGLGTEPHHIARTLLPGIGVVSCSAVRPFAPLPLPPPPLQGMPGPGFRVCTTLCRCAVLRSKSKVSKYKWCRRRAEQVQVPAH